MAGLSGRDALVSGGRWPDGRRGQLLFVTAIGLAVLLIVLSATLNATVDTGGLGPDGTATDGTSDALRYQADARAAIGAVMERGNREAGSTYAELEAALDERVGDWSAFSARHAARDGTAVQVALVDATDGTRLAQTNASRDLTNVDGNESWTLVNDADRVRAIHLGLESDALVGVSNPSPSAGHLESKEVFTLSLSGDGDSVRAFVYRNDSGSVVLSVDEGAGSLTGPCAVPVGPDGRYDVDVTGARVAGSDCAALEAFADVDGPYAVAVANGDNAAGTYSLVVDRRVSEIDTTDYHADADATGPTATRALYDATVETTFENRRVDATTHLRIAPGEFDD